MIGLSTVLSSVKDEVHGDGEHMMPHGERMLVVKFAHSIALMFVVARRDTGVAIVGPVM